MSLVKTYCDKQSIKLNCDFTAKIEFNKQTNKTHTTEKTKAALSTYWTFI